MASLLVTLSRLYDSVSSGLYRMLPDAALRPLPNTGHNPPGERPAWFNAIALDFLARRYGTPAPDR